MTALVGIFLAVCAGLAVFVWQEATRALRAEDERDKARKAWWAAETAATDMWAALKQAEAERDAALAEAEDERDTATAATKVLGAEIARRVEMEVSRDEWIARCDSTGASRVDALRRAETFQTAFRGELTRQVGAEVIDLDAPAERSVVVEFPTGGESA